MKITLFLLSILISLSCYSEQLSEKNLQGYYTYISGDSSYQEFALFKDNNFQSWLHQKPASTGSWVFKDNIITIQESGFEEAQLKVININKKTITLLFIKLKEEAIFERSELTH